MAVYKSIEGYGLRVSSMAPIANLAGLFGIGLDPDRPQPTSSTFFGRKDTREALYYEHFHGRGVQVPEV